MLSCEFWKTFQNALSTEHLRTNAFILNITQDPIVKMKMKKLNSVKQFGFKEKEETISWKLPLGKFPPIKLPPGKFPAGKFPPRKFPPGIFPPTFLIFLFFHYCHRYDWYYLKDFYFVILFLKVLQCIKKFSSLLTEMVTNLKKNVLLVKYDNRSLS